MSTICAWHVATRRAAPARGATTLPPPPPRYPELANFTWRYPNAAGAAAWEGVPFPENAGATRARCMAAGNTCTWTHDLWTSHALAALDAHAARVRALGASAAPPLFLYLAYTDPHAGGWSGTDEAGNPVPSDDGRVAFSGETAWPANERDHASVIVNFQDRDVGALVARLDALGLTADTAVLFASDNGASNEGGHDYAFFGSSGPLRGFKRCLTEGGIRTPLSITWPGRVAAGVTSPLPVAFWDVSDTILELAGVPAAARLRQDGASFAAALASPSGVAPGAAGHPLYWEFCTAVHPPLEPRKGTGWGHAVRNDTWKLVSFFVDQAPRLYDLSADVYEVNDVAAANPAVAAALEAWAKAQHVDSAIFPVVDCTSSAFDHW